MPVLRRVEYKYELGDGVVFVDSEAHRASPDVFPPVGTVGVVVGIDSVDGFAYVSWRHAPELIEGLCSRYDFWYSFAQLAPKR